MGMCNRGNVNFYAEIRKRGVGARGEKRRKEKENMKRMN